MNLENRINALRGVEPARVVTAPQLFPTPAIIAEKMVDYLNPQEKDRILEPSAGTGNLLTAICNNNKGIPTAIEINASLCDSLKSTFPLTTVLRMDFFRI